MFDKSFLDPSANIIGHRLAALSSVSATALQAGLWYDLDLFKIYQPGGLDFLKGIEQEADNGAGR